MPDSIIDLWEKYNVTNGADIILVSKYMVDSLSLCYERNFMVFQTLPNCTRIEIYFSCYVTCMCSRPWALIW